MAPGKHQYFIKNWVLAGGAGPGRPGKQNKSSFFETLFRSMLEKGHTYSTYKYIFWNAEAAQKRVGKMKVIFPSKFTVSEAFSRRNECSRYDASALVRARLVLPCTGVQR